MGRLRDASQSAEQVNPNCCFLSGAIIQASLNIFSSSFSCKLQGVLISDSYLCIRFSWNLLRGLMFIKDTQGGSVSCTNTWIKDSEHVNFVVLVHSVSQKGPYLNVISDWLDNWKEGTPESKHSFLTSIILQETSKGEMANDLEFAIYCRKTQMLLAFKATNVKHQTLVSPVRDTC